jgi:hypothetical protein
MFIDGVGRTRYSKALYSKESGGCIWIAVFPSLFSREGGSPVWVPAFAGKHGKVGLRA